MIYQKIFDLKKKKRKRIYTYFLGLDSNVDVLLVIALYTVVLIAGHIPRPVTGLEVLTVHQAPRAGLQQGTPEHADIVQAAVTRMRVVTKFFRTSEVSFLKKYS